MSAHSSSVAGVVLNAPPLPDLLPPEGSDGAADAPLNPLEPRLPLEPIGPIGPIGPLRRVRCGCWLISYRPKGAPLVAYDGTLRVECHSAGRTASGDLYQRRVIFLREPSPVLPGLPGLPGLPKLAPFLAAAPSPAAGIPILPRGRYRHYVRVTSLPENFYIGSSFNLGFELYRYTAPNSWVLDATLTAKMTRMTAPAGFPSASDYAEGDVKNTAGTIVGRLTMGWLSSYFRKAVIEIDTVAGSERPTTSGAGHTWATVMDALGWQVSVSLSDTNVAEASGASWSDAEMHAAMLARRAAVNLDTQWRYHVLAVKNIDSTPRGIMYDSGGTDSNNVPREGVGISSHWIITANWGTVGGQRFGAAPAPYFRTAVHEVGHAMGLFHTTGDLGFMNTSDVIAAAGTAATPFPSNIQWAYHPTNLKQLRHYPDPFVRPGGVAFGGASISTPPISPTDLEVDVNGLVLQLKPLLSEVPLGAPVRLDYCLVNQSDIPLAVPARLSLKGEAVSGVVTDPAGTRRSFRPLQRCAEDHEFVVLAPGEMRADSATLLRGAEGALFASPGVHRIELEVHWEADDMVASVRGEATVMVTGVMDAEHAAAAHQILSTPDVHLVLALGGDHMLEGIAAIHTAMGSAVLRPHYALIEAKRLGRQFGKRKADMKAAAAMVDAGTVMSGAEAAKLAQIGNKDKVTGVGKELGKTLKARAKGAMMSGADKKAMDAL